MALKLIFWLFLFTFCTISHCTSQSVRASTWLFGQGIGIKFFGKPLDTFSVKQGYEFSYEGCGIFNDSAGKILYHSDNSSLFDSKHNFILPKYNLGGAASSSQASLLTSINDSILHCFGTNPILGIYGGYTYNEYDMINNKWLTLNKIIHYPISEAQAHVNHQNGHWQWVLSHSRLGDTLYSYLITDDGLETCPVISHAGPFYNDWYPGQGVMKFSADGKYLFVGAWSLGKVTVCDFNNQTGLISEKFRIDITDSFPYGIETQGNNLFVSFNRPNDIIFQYSFKKMDYLSVMNSRKLLFDTSVMDAIGQLQLAPDGKIYVAVVNQSRLAFLDPAKNYKYSYTKNLFGTKKCYGGFPNFNASYFHTPSLNFNYTRNCETNTFKFTATDTFAANNWQWKFTKGNVLQTQSGNFITHTFSDTVNWLVHCIAGNGSRYDTIVKAIEIQKPLQKQFLGEDILFAAGANITGSLAVNNFQNPHCLHWQKLGDTAEKLGNTYTYKDTGTFICKATNSVFCSYTDTIKVRVCDSFARAALIERSGDSLFTKTYAAKYQWYKNDSAINSATKPALKVTQKGIYKLRTWNKQSCDSFSALFDVNKLGIQPINSSEIQIYPNPNQGNFIIKSEKQVLKSVIIYDILGNKIYDSGQLNSQFIEINQSIKLGIYCIKINDMYLQKMVVN